ncbi:MAG: dihydropteroate synthase [Victivallales bacterium]|jgi:dihydropteroate synthase|nr:dihydropteroate synthase [Victivallales bacterium]MBT7304041.1 dihydropteroate synthase [Victivallales bacterium]
MQTLNFRYRDQCLALGERTLLMGILNTTPDSFSDGGEHAALDQAVRHARQMIDEGADILDIGGESTRPGAPAVDAAEEIRRTVPVIQELRRSLAIPISIDTTKAAVAEAALEAGADMVNDVSGLDRDPDLPRVLGKWRAGCILMHMRGTPETMRELTQYDDVLTDIRDSLAASLRKGVEQSGLSEEFFMLDPGIGFAKTAEQSVQLIAAIPELRQLGRPILMGPSRKSFIGHLLDQPDPHQRVWGTAGACAACSLLQADVVRIHDVAAIRDAVRVADAVRQHTDRHFSSQ